MSEPILPIRRIRRLHRAPETPGGPLALKDVLIRAQASKAQGPIDFQRIIIFFSFFFFFSFLFNHPGTFGGLNMLKNS